VETKPRFALVVGHNEKSQGAVNYLGESEWVFNKRIARKVQEIMTSWGYTTAIIYRPAGTRHSTQVNYVGEKASELGVQLAFCLHFNSYSKVAYGCEVLVTEDAQAEVISIADVITDELNERLGLVERHEDGVNFIHSGHNGYQMLHELGSRGIMACLLEPCFANFRTKESEAIFENEDTYANIIASAAKKLLG